MKRKYRRGQSVLEYVIILTAIIAVIVIAARGPITAAVNQLMQQASGSISGAAGRLPQ